MININLGKAEKRLVAEKFMELANLTIVALAITQLLSDSVDLVAAGIGIVLFGVEYYFAYRLVKGGD